MSPTRSHATATAAALLSAFLIAAQFGCYTTAGSRQAARTATTQISTYRDQQAGRIERLNQEYNDAFNEMMETLDHLTQTELQQGRDADAQVIADALATDNSASLRGRFRSSFANAVTSQRQRIHDADLAVAAIRENYTKSYVEAKLELNKLKTVLDDLKKLSVENIDEVREAARVIKIFSDAYQKARDEAKKQAATN